MDWRKNSRLEALRREFQMELDAAQRRSGQGRRRTDGLILIGTTLVRAIAKNFSREAANDTGCQNQPIRARLGAKSRANLTVFRAHLRKLKTQASRAASPALARLCGLLDEALWSVKTITSPQTHQCSYSVGMVYRRP